MSKRRQHFVPQFYLRSFQSADRQIHLYHLASRRAIRSASLRDQCYIHRFYGPSDEIEDRLAELEGAAAPIVHEICESGHPPSPGTEQHAILLAFVGLQILQTPAARRNLQDVWVKMDAQVFGDSEPLPESGLSRFSPLLDHEALAMQFKTLPKYIEALDDLRIHVAQAGLRDNLITSDNPAFKFNSYCRGIRYWGSVGANCRGLQLVLPLSPTVVLLLYDDAVYKVSGEKGSSAGRIFRGDVERLNGAQIINAQDCVYFSDWSKVEEVHRLATSNMTYRQRNVMRVDEAPLEGEENSSTVHSWESQPELPFSLPFSGLRLQAKRVPLEKRVNTYRREWLV